jgi:phage shock protein A
MGIFSRLTDIINANLNSLLERAEDPEKMVRLMIQEMEDTLVEVRSQTVRAMAEKRDVERKLTRILDAAGEWERKAEFALTRLREDLAKGALLARRKLDEQADVLRRELSLLDDAMTRHNGDLAKLQAKLEEAKARKKALELRMRTAADRVRVKKSLHDPRVDDALSRYESLERRIDELDAEAEVYDRGTERTLVDEFADLEAEEAINQDLAALKARVQGQQA